MAPIRSTDPDSRTSSLHHLLSAAASSTTALGSRREDNASAGPVGPIGGGTPSGSAFSSRRSSPVAAVGPLLPSDRPLRDERQLPPLSSILARNNHRSARQHDLRSAAPDTSREAAQLPLYTPLSLNAQSRPPGPVQPRHSPESKGKGKGKATVRGGGPDNVAPVDVESELLSHLTRAQSINDARAGHPLRPSARSEHFRSISDVWRAFDNELDYLSRSDPATAEDLSASMKDVYDKAATAAAGAPAASSEAFPEDVRSRSHVRDEPAFAAARRSMHSEPSASTVALSAANDPTARPNSTMGSQAPIQYYRAPSPSRNPTADARRAGPGWSEQEHHPVCSPELAGNVDGGNGSGSSKSMDRLEPLGMRSPTTAFAADIHPVPEAAILPSSTVPSSKMPPVRTWTAGDAPIPGGQSIAGASVSAGAKRTATDAATAESESGSTAYDELLSRRRAAGARMKRKEGANARKKNEGSSKMAAAGLAILPMHQGHYPHQHQQLQYQHQHYPPPPHQQPQRAASDSGPSRASEGSEDEDGLMLDSGGGGGDELSPTQTMMALSPAADRVRYADSGAGSGSGSGSGGRRGSSSRRSFEDVPQQHSHPHPQQQPYPPSHPHPHLHPPTLGGTAFRPSMAHSMPTSPSNGSSARRHLGPEPLSAYPHPHQHQHPYPQSHPQQQQQQQQHAHLHPPPPSSLPTLQHRRPSSSLRGGASEDVAGGTAGETGGAGGAPPRETFSSSSAPASASAPAPASASASASTSTPNMTPSNLAHRRSLPFVLQPESSSSAAATSSTPSSSSASSPSQQQPPQQQTQAQEQQQQQQPAYRSAALSSFSYRLDTFRSSSASAGTSTTATSTQRALPLPLSLSGRRSNATSSAGESHQHQHQHQHHQHQPPYRQQRQPQQQQSSPQQQS
ncbi:hypothetical protein OC844_007143 [Tilletia horrida]|nr:hypothetical protein OC844_007143 [Tilletia horrida]